MTLLLECSPAMEERLRFRSATKGRNGSKWSKVDKESLRGLVWILPEGRMEAGAGRGGADRSQASFGSGTARLLISAFVVCRWVESVKKEESNASSTG